MKTLVTIIALSAIGAGAALAQGNIAFANSTTYALKVTDGTVSQVIGTASTLLGPASVRVQLWVGANNAPLGSLVLVGTCTNTSSTLSFAQGTFNGGNPLVLPAPFDGSAPVEFLYKAWSQLSSPTLEAATAGYIGMSALVTGYTPTTGTTLPVPTFGTGAGQLSSGLTLTPIIPEPTSLALAGLGLAGLLAIRRRK